MSLVKINQPYILVFDRSLENCKILTQAIRDISITKVWNAEFQYHNPDEVFSSSMPNTALLAFFTVSSMYDVEAVRKFHALHRDTPLTIVSDTEVFGSLSWEVGACYYLTRPVHKVKLQKAFQKMFELCS